MVLEVVRLLVVQGREVALEAEAGLAPQHLARRGLRAAAASPSCACAAARKAWWVVSGRVIRMKASTASA